MPGGGGPKGENLKGYVWREEGWGEEEGRWMVRGVGEGSGPFVVEEEKDAGGGGGGEARGVEKQRGGLKGLCFPQVPEWGEHTWTVVVGALRQPPREGRG